MSGLRTADLYAFAWRNVRRLPDALVRGGAHLVADVVWALRLSGVRQLQSNLHRLRPDLDPRELRRCSRAGMRSYLRYFAEAFQLPGWTPERIAARVRPVGAERVTRVTDDAGTAVLALGHSGNWDLAGAWAGAHIAPVLTVAEKLPDGLYEEFLAFRSGLGIEIVPFEKGGGTFRTLVRKARTGPRIVPLLADRDLSAHGVEVTIAGHAARVAAGPAALASTGSHELLPVAIHYERLRGERRRAAGSPWGLVVEFLPAIPTRDADGRRRPLDLVTQEWVTALFDAYARHPEDWHMLQKVFLSDLDADRLARQRARASEGAPS
ncbi:MAG: phosphatidylinositol mannoside acyltransferase [Micrococcales bacterium 73-15]|uniref:phosphatidylinositol mannoside acyltransferase n=1 Tax=Salana multivorans TaxID=120377 RepID=UPI0009600F83|nr:phosphatidylinositol mannoside acyltransferase [Salana multivorans]OJX94394.1 MAG: phosphatidylinositol mannoside acyltransferase [Micrococcales bacterium 73-15]